MFFMIFCLTKMAVLEDIIPLGKSDLLEKSMKFVNCNDWFPTKNSVLYIKLLDDKFILKRKWNKRNWDLHPFPTIQLEKKKKKSLLLTTTELRNPLKLLRIIHQPNELQDFFSTDMVKDINHLEEERFCL